MKKIYIAIICTVFCIVIIMGLSGMKNNFSITGKIIDISNIQKNTIIIDEIVNHTFSQNIPIGNNLVNMDIDYRNYWVENKENISNIFNSYIEEFRQIDCIDYNGLRELLQPNQKIKVIADNLTFSLTTELEIVYTLHQFVYNNIKYEEINSFLTPEQILSIEKGDCSEKSVLLAALLEAMNINTYVAESYEHRYVFAIISETWMPIDSSTSDFYFVYKNWNNNNIKYYNPDIQPFILNSTATLFNKNWCI